MSTSWKNWEGQSAGERYHLGRCLGASEHSAVFLTLTGDREPGNAAIKLVSASAGAQERLAQWRSAAKVTNANLLRILDSGRTQVAGADVLFLVTEYAEEDLSQILPQRPLTPDETRAMLEPVLDTLLFLHEKGLAHGSLKPSNVLASGDRILLSSDSIRRTGEKRGTPLAQSPYQAPEQEFSPAADVWSLGVSLVEILTQRLPVSDPAPGADPIVPDPLPAPFLEIARNCLRRDPLRRWSTAEIILRLDPHSAAALAAVAAAKAKPKASAAPRPAPAQPAAEAAPTPVTVSPLSPVQPLPERERRAAQRVASASSRANALSGSRYALPLATAAALLLVIFGIAKWQRRDSSASRSVPAAVEPRVSIPPAKSSEGSSSAKKAERARPEPRQSSQAAPAQKPPDASVQPASEKQPVRSEPPPPSDAPKSTKPSVVSRGEVLEQFLPQVSQKARDTIRGIVRVAVKVHVDESGAVTAAELNAPSSSKYFSEQALQAAQRWTFQPPEIDGRPVASDWRLSFDFSPSDTKVTPSQLTR